MDCKPSSEEQCIHDEKLLGSIQHVSSREDVATCPDSVLHQRHAHRAAE